MSSELKTAVSPKPNQSNSDKEDDIDKIMNDIESMQAELGAVSKAKPEPIAPQKSIIPEVHDMVSSQESHESHESDLTEKVEEQDILKEFEQSGDPVHFEPVAAEVEEMSDMDNTHEESSLSMSIQGHLTLNLNYGHTGQFISLEFTSEMIRIQLADGTEFKIPNRQRATKKVA